MKLTPDHHQTTTITPRLRTSICESHEVLFYIGFEPTTLSKVARDVATVKTTRPTVQFCVVKLIPKGIKEGMIG